MPELPEVDSLREQLSLLVKDQGFPKVESIWTSRKKMRRPYRSARLENLGGQKWQGIRRRAKYLIFEFEDEVILAHLGMSGHWRVETESFSKKKHDHFILIFKDFQLVYHDPRRFGFVEALSKPELENHSWLVDLGPEPLGPELNVKGLRLFFSKTSRPVKSVIMDQKCVVGVGNIYASEALFRAGVRPQRKAKSLSSSEIKKLIQAIRWNLKLSMKEGGTTLKDYLGLNEEQGGFAKRLKVYGREGESCASCRTKVRAMRMDQRSTFWCPTCQS